VTLDHQPHNNQFKKNMFKIKTNNRSKANDMNVINKRDENTRGKKPCKTM
jgi:hypothetical protein